MCAKLIRYGIILALLLAECQLSSLPETLPNSSDENECSDANCDSPELQNLLDTTTVANVINNEHQPLCDCQPDSSEALEDTAEDSSLPCANKCPIVLETDTFKETTTMQPIDYEFDFGQENDTAESEENTDGVSISTDGLTFGASNHISHLVHPDDAPILAFYRRAFNRYMSGEDNNFERIQAHVSYRLLKTLGWKMADVERIMKWNWIPRDKNGFRLAGRPLNVPLPANGKVYSSVGGISFYNNGSYSLNLMEADAHNALFNSDDVELIMKRGITGASFSLNPPFGSSLPHPFQKATWEPNKDLADTDFLFTLLHADIWLKSVDMQAEISSLSPFKTRRVTKKSSSAPPDDLYERLYDTHSTEENTLLLAARQWIESGPIKYNYVEGNDAVTYFFGPANMSVKQNSILRRVRNNITGLIDTYIGGSSPKHEHLSATLTENYNKFGNYFPELLRLGELGKLAAISLVFQHYYKRLALAVLPPSTDSVAKVLNANNLRNQVFGGAWPFVTDQRVEDSLDRLLLQQGFKLSEKHRVLNLVSARMQIRQLLTSIQNNKTREVAEAIAIAFNISSDTISNGAISSYLANNSPDAENPLLNEIIIGINHRINIHSAGLVRLYKAMSESGYKVNNNTDTLPEFSQVSVGKQITVGNNSVNDSLWYYVPTTTLRNVRSNGRFYPVRGGIKLRTLLQFDPTLKHTSYPWNFPKVDIFTPTLGSLSAKYETGGRGSGTINNYKKGASGDPGGASYGTYQIATKTGTMKGFLKFLNEKDTKMAEKLNSLTPGTDEFDEEWKNLANKEEFGTFQHDFIKSTHYDKTLSKLSTNYKLDMNLDQRSSVIKDVIWSTSVQHGPSGAAKVINNALEGQDIASLTDKEIIKRVYAERGAENGMKYFSKSSEAIRKGVVNRFENEERDAVKQLE
ncbi:unnamed protein product [Rotaria magnacalcarata]|uniref:Type VI secretion system spike protein VgrG3-like C-terminal domain-containing protein n=1 Tax=Rotaria magnacalcarata TaxID=392030 RepID=A0A816D2Q9_9BILA|nr:unnamed protein product [Rotaria magnacalcarata]